MAEPREPKLPKTVRVKGKSTPRRSAKSKVEDAVVTDDDAVETLVLETPDVVPTADVTDPTETTEGTKNEASSEAMNEAKAKTESILDAPNPPPPQNRAGGGTLLLGGVLAVLIGAGALYFAQSSGWIDLGDARAELRAKVDAQEAEIVRLRAILDSALADTQSELAAISDTTKALTKSGAETQIEIDEINGAVDNITQRVGEATIRLAEVETQPIPKAEIPAELAKAVDARMEDVALTMNGRFAELQAELVSKIAELEAAQVNAAISEAELAKAADLAASVAAMSRIEVALDSGIGFADVLGTFADKSGLEIPDALIATAERGITTLKQLQSSFPDAARAALSATAQDAATDSSGNRVTAFLRTQLGVRSLEPREGDDPDAILSRVEAALGTGNLDAALQEIAALPEAGRAAMSDWFSQAETRHKTLLSFAELSALINTN